jgi:hypothetical protein
VGHQGGALTNGLFFFFFSCSKLATAGGLPLSSLAYAFALSPETLHRSQLDGVAQSGTF